ncbi:MAG: hypothetical protein UU32_C0051G0008 [Candidatus Woesebacteria bacterium GW2011_GWB1_41_10]|uniref:Uncharacterized protein n=1 Tax=Candidatus Woesebacteria bacterium GW2011_GWB1_41_10 TaxID=1618577 RepID=A0A0G0X8Q6_9BACT|nr:MAG: hypothetical protein UU32_C0051G0008 [Candidatus Woesebacteria bacterium GW2011_GWB1_41_10]
MSGVNSPDLGEVSQFRKYFSMLVELREKDDPTVRKAIGIIGIHGSWTDEALGSQKGLTWLNLVNQAAQMATDPEVEREKRQQLQDKLNELEVFVDLKKPTTDRDNQRRLRELHALTGGVK